MFVYITLLFFQIKQDAKTFEINSNAFAFECDPKTFAFDGVPGKWYLHFNQVKHLHSNALTYIC